jgi:two-component system, OmpR family, osmolarity sensor histidine kinase EnvZ
VLSVVLTKKSLIFRIEDNGPGIPKDKWDEAIKPFTKLDISRNQNKGGGGGVGLGLAISSDIARTHGGKLKLSESIKFGGLCAEIVIPV